MKFSEDVLTSLNLEPLKEKEPVNIMKISEMLDFMKKSSERLIKANCISALMTLISRRTA